MEEAIGFRHCLAQGAARGRAFGGAPRFGPLERRAQALVGGRRLGKAFQIELDRAPVVRREQVVAQRL